MLPSTVCREQIASREARLLRSGYLNTGACAGTANHSSHVTVRICGNDGSINSGSELFGRDRAVITMRSMFIGTITRVDEGAGLISCAEVEPDRQAATGGSMVFWVDSDDHTAFSISFGTTNA